MNKLILILLTTLLFSCEKISSVTSLFYNNSAPEPIDFTQVDQYPKFDNCDALLNYEESKVCFQQTVHQKISERLQYLKLTTEQQVTDTLLIQFTIDKDGYFSCNKINAGDSLRILIPNLSVEIKEIILGMPPVRPAQKRGIPITSSYTVPLVIETK